MNFLRHPARRIAAPLVVLAVAMAGCATPEGTTGDSTDGVELTAGQFSWTASEVEIDILAKIAEDHPELGVSSIDTVNVDPAVGWSGLDNGDIDFLTEANLPNQQAFADKTSANTELVSETYGGATQGWFVPKYLVEPGGAAEGLKSIDQLADPKYAQAVGGTLYDADPGWVTTQENEERIKAYGLKVEQNASSEGALIAQLTRAYQAKEPVLIYFYRPHWLFTQFDLVQLEEPKPYRDGCFTEDGPADCAIPTLAAWTAARKDLTTRAPKFAAVLKNFKIPLEDVEKMLAENENDKTSPEDLAKQWVSENSDTVNSWLA